MRVQDSPRGLLPAHSPRMANNNSDGVYFLIVTFLVEILINDVAHVSHAAVCPACMTANQCRVARGSRRTALALALLV